MFLNNYPLLYNEFCRVLRIVYDLFDSPMQNYEEQIFSGENIAKV